MRRTSPVIALTDPTLMPLVWFAHETDRDADGAINLPLDFYLEWRDSTRTVETIEQCLTLAKELELADIQLAWLETRKKRLERTLGGSSGTVGRPLSGVATILGQKRRCQDCPDILPVRVFGWRIALNQKEMVSAHRLDSVVGPQQ